MPQLVQVLGEPMLCIWRLSSVVTWCVQVTATFLTPSSSQISLPQHLQTASVKDTNLPEQIGNLRKVTDPRLTHNTCPAPTQPPTVARRLCISLNGPCMTAELQSAAGPRIGLFAAARGPAEADGQ